MPYTLFYIIVFYHQKSLWAITLTSLINAWRKICCSKERERERGREREKKTAEWKEKNWTPLFLGSHLTSYHTLGQKATIPFMSHYSWRLELYTHLNNKQTDRLQWTWNVSHLEISATQCAGLRYSHQRFAQTVWLCWDLLQTGQCSSAPTPWRGSDHTCHSCQGQQYHWCWQNLAK